MKRTIHLALLVLPVGTALGQTKSAKTDAQIRQTLIAESIAAYEGNCPCPYSKNRAGRSCGGNSAYSKPGGASPLCYDKDVTQKMVDEYRKRPAK
jgi:hypothetical protein